MVGAGGFATREKYRLIGSSCRVDWTLVVVACKAIYDFAGGLINQENALADLKVRLVVVVYRWSVVTDSNQL